MWLDWSRRAAHVRVDYSDRLNLLPTEHPQSECLPVQPEWTRPEWTQVYHNSCFAARSWPLWNIRNKLTIEETIPNQPADYLFKMLIYMQLWRQVARMEGKPGLGGGGEPLQLSPWIARAIFVLSVLSRYIRRAFVRLLCYVRFGWFCNVDHVERIALLYKAGQGLSSKNYYFHVCCL